MNELIALLLTLDNCTGTITTSPDFIYPASVESDIDYGVACYVRVNESIVTGRGLTFEEALAKLTEKIKDKYKI